MSHFQKCTCPVIRTVIIESHPLLFISDLQGTMAGTTLLLLLASSFFTTVKLFTHSLKNVIFPSLFCVNQVVSNPTDLDDVAKEMVRRVEETKATKEVHNRNMQTWWGEYTTELKAYKDIFDQYACTDSAKLEADLTALEAKIAKVSPVE